MSSKDDGDSFDMKLLERAGAAKEKSSVSVAQEHTKLGGEPLLCGTCSDHSRVGEGL